MTSVVPTAAPYPTAQPYYAAQPYPSTTPATQVAPANYQAMPVMNEPPIYASAATGPAMGRFPGVLPFVLLSFELDFPHFLSG